jgi:hypothetical protein
MKPRSDGVTLIAIYQFIVGFLSFLGICGLLSIPMIVAASTAAYRAEGGAIATTIVGIAMIFAAGVLLLVAAANVIVGWGLWKQQEWGRIGGIVLAVLRLLSFPIGTLIGALTLWYLFREDVRLQFQPQPAAPQPTALQLPESPVPQPPEPSQSPEG